MATNIPYQTGGLMLEGYVTPEVKLSEGFNSTGNHRPAPWLPLQRFNQEARAHVVISRGKPVAYANGFLVPAGLKLELDAVKDGDPATIKYTAEDVRNGVKNAAGTLVAVDEAVVTSLIAQNIDVSYFAGIANYDYFRHGGGDGTNPADFNFYNQNPQARVSYSMDYHFEYPLVKDNDAYAAAPLAGISAFIGTSVKPGQFVTYNKASNFVAAAADFTYGTTDAQAILGQVSQVFVIKDPTTGDVVNSVNYLEKVVAPANITGNPLNELPSARNGGVPQKVTYANGFGYVRFGLQTR